MEATAFVVAGSCYGVCSFKYCSLRAFHCNERPFFLSPSLSSSLVLENRRKRQSVIAIEITFNRAPRVRSPVLFRILFNRLFGIVSREFRNVFILLIGNNECMLFKYNDATVFHRYTYGEDSSWSNQC